MIRINLLPQEFRKRSSSISLSQNALIGLAGAVVALLAVAFWGWVTYVRIPLAEEKVEQREDTVKEIKKQVAAIEKQQKQIKQIEQRIAFLEGLQGQQMHWARTLWDFVELMAPDDPEHWNGQQFRVSVDSLSIREAKTTGRRSKKQQQVTPWSFDFTFTLVGTQDDKGGEYLRAFWATIGASAFWQRHGFLNQPQDAYTFDEFQWDEELERDILQMALKWQRVPVIDKKSSGAGKGG
ncbi:MAG: hypothetical protein ACOCZK_01260 [Planctomycetota bacterium]